MFLYLIAMLRPVAPFVEYAVNYDYISKVLCVNKDNPELGCNGKCHLMKQLKKQQNDDFKSLRVSLEEYPIGFVELVAVSSKVITSVKTIHQFFYQENYSYLREDSMFRPPSTFIL